MMARFDLVLWFSLELPSVIGAFLHYGFCALGSDNLDLLLPFPSVGYFPELISRCMSCSECNEMMRSVGNVFLL